MVCSESMAETWPCRGRDGVVAPMFQLGRREQAIADGLRSPLLQLWDVMTMNAYVSPEERQVLPATLISYPEHHAEASYRQRTKLSAVVEWVRGYFERRAILAELNSLSERELNDIGLSRAGLRAQVLERP